MNLTHAGILQKDGAVDVYYLVAQEELEDEAIKALAEFVENGGGLLVCGHAWAWKTDNKSFVNFPTNK